MFSRQVLSRTHLLCHLIALILVSASAAPAGGFDIGRELGSCFSGGCDVIWKVNQRIDAGISSKTQSAIEPVQAAIHQILTELFQGDIDPMLDKLDTIGEKQLNHINDIVQKAIDKASSATETTIESVKRNIIDESADQIKGVSGVVSHDLICTELTTKQQAQDFIDNNFKVFGSIRDSLHGLVDHCAAGLDRNNYWTVYSGLKCAYEAKISNASTIGEMQEFYRSFLEETAKAECVLLSDENKHEARSDQVLYTKRLNIWKLALK